MDWRYHLRWPGLDVLPDVCRSPLTYVVRRVMRTIAELRRSRTVAELPSVAKPRSIALTSIPRSAEVHGAQNRRKPILQYLVFCLFISPFVNYHTRRSVVMQKDGATAAKKRDHSAKEGSTSRTTRRSACNQKTADGTGLVMSILWSGDVGKRNDVDDMDDRGR